MHPVLRTDNPLLNSAFRVAIGDLVGNIQPFEDGLLTEPRPCILAGLEYNTPWTRDTAINVWNGVGLIFPEASRNTLLSVLERRDGQVFIGGQYWDAIIWTTGAWAYYCYTGDSDLLELAFHATRNTLDLFEATEFNTTTGLFRGPACYGDGVAAYPDRYARTGGSSSILEWPKHNPRTSAPVGYGIPMQALSTNVLYANAYRLLGEMARVLDEAEEAAWEQKSAALKAAINRHFWDEERGNYRYLVDEWGGSDHQEGLGSSFALLIGIADEAQARRVIASQYITAYGIPCVWPSYERYRRMPDSYGRHSGTVWPHVQGFWAEAAAKFGAPDKFAFELFTLAKLAVRDGMFAEIYHPDTGAIYGGLQEGTPDWQWHSCRRQTWSATGFLRMVLMGLIGMDVTTEGITFRPNLPEGVSRLELSGMVYQGSPLDVVVRGQGSRIKSFRVNGKESAEAFVATKMQGTREIEIEVGSV